MLSDRGHVKWSAVSFDLDGTLYDYDTCHRAALRETARMAENKLGIPCARFVRLYQESRAITHERLRGTASSHNRLLYFHDLITLHTAHLCLKSVKRLESAYWSAFFDQMKLFPGVTSLLERLRLRSIKIALITDMVAAIQFEKIIRLGLGDIFDVVVTSEEAGCEKPNRGIFELSIRRLNVPMHALVHVGDDYSRDVEGAKQVGLDAIWFAPRAKGKGAIRKFSKLERLLCPHT